MILRGKALQNLIRMTSLKPAFLLAALAACSLAVTGCGRKQEEAPPAPSPSEQAPPPAISTPPQAPATVPATPTPPPVVNPKPSKAPSIISGPLKRSDVLLSPRFYRSDWLDAFHAFYATRIVWTYAGKRLVGEAAAENIPVQCTIPFWVPKDAPDRNAMACVDPGGELVSMAPTLVFPDVNSDEWRRYVLSETEKLVDSGCTSFQQDGAWLNYQSSIWRNGCYSAETRAEFRTYTVSSAPSGDQLSQQSSDTEHPATRSNAVDDRFESFQKHSTAAYHEWLHDSIRTYAESKSPQANVTFSGNFASSLLANGRSGWLLPEFDFVLSEAFGDRKSMPNVLRVIARQTSNIVGVSGVTIPRDDVWLNQRSIASAYALGLTAIVPWDVHVKVGGQRFFGHPGDFAPLLRLVRNNPALFDDYVSSEDYGAEHGLVLPGQGTVTKVDRITYPDRTTVFWSRGPSFREVAKDRQIVVGGVGYRTTEQSKVGAIYLARGASVSVGDPLYFMAGADSYLISVRRNTHEPRKRAVHAVSWREKPVALYLHLRRSDFPEPPTMLVTPDNPTPKPIEPRAIGEYYIYPVGGAVWAILY